MIKIYFKKYFAILFLLLWCISCFACKVIVLFGPSCAGKSVLGKSLCAQLGISWEFVDRDDLIEQRADKADRPDQEELYFLANEINKRLHDKNANLVVDTNLYTDDFITLINTASVMRVLVYVPLNVLLERDAQRTQLLQRSAKNAYYAKQFVLNTYEYYISNAYANKKIVCQEKSGENMYARFDCDICINTQSMPINAASDLIQEWVAKKLSSLAFKPKD